MSNEALQAHHLDPTALTGFTPEQALKEAQLRSDVRSAATNVAELPARHEARTQAFANDSHFDVRLARPGVRVENALSRVFWRGVLGYTRHAARKHVKNNLDTYKAEAEISAHQDGVSINH